MFKDEFEVIRSDRKTLRNFGITMGCALGVIGAVLLWKEMAVWVYFVGVAAVFLLLGLVVPTVLKTPNRLWMMLAVVLGAIVSRVILTLFFLVIFTPIGLAAKLSGKSFLDLGETEKSSYWIAKEKKEDKTRYEKQY